MGLTLVCYLVTAAFVACPGTLALEPGAGSSKVFQVTGTAAILAYCFAFISNNIWFGTPKHAILMDVLDGVVYSPITGAVFGVMRPQARAEAIQTSPAVANCLQLRHPG